VPKILDAWSRSPKFEFRLHRSGYSNSKHLKRSAPSLLPLLNIPVFFHSLPEESNVRRSYTAVPSWFSSKVTRSPLTPENFKPGQRVDILNVKTAVDSSERKRLLPFKHQLSQTSSREDSTCKFTLSSSDISMRLYG